MSISAGVRAWRDLAGFEPIKPHAEAVGHASGLFRVIAWVLNGLELDVHNATLETDESGLVS